MAARAPRLWGSHPRLITNPAPTLRRPMRFDRAPPDAHSPVEVAVLRALGADRFAFRPATPRESNFVPHHFRGNGEAELVALLDSLGVTMAAAGDSCRNTLPPPQPATPDAVAAAKL